MPAQSSPSAARLPAFRQALLALLAAATLPAAAMNVVTQGDTVFASGPVGDDIKAFETALAQPGITTVAFVDSPGGKLLTGLKVGMLIARKGLNTVVAGRCLSACSVMFMGGRERRYADNHAVARTLIGIHGAHRTDLQPVTDAQRQLLFNYYRARIGPRFQPAIIRQAIDEMDDPGAMLRIYDPVRESSRRPLHCRSGQTPLAQCTVYRDQDALTLGIATHADLVTLRLPESLAAPQLFGHALGEPVPDPRQAVASQLGRPERLCLSDACKDLISRWGGLEEHKALAVPVSGPGYGFSHSQESAENAFASAVRACNHPRGIPARLCEVRIVNRNETGALYAEAEREHASALAQLREPAAPNHAGEESGGVATTAELRTQKFTDATPTELPGIETIATGELARMLLAPAGPVVIDVSGAVETLPTARALLLGGLAFDSAEREAAYQQRFAAMLSLLAPDRSQPLVFSGSGKQSWLPVNAALRASRLGYSRVRWYRGGLESWKAAGLPTAPLILRAVAN